MRVKHHLVWGPTGGSNGLDPGPFRSQELDSTERFRASQAAKLEKLYEVPQGVGSQPLYKMMVNDG